MESVSERTKLHLTMCGMFLYFFVFFLFLLFIFFTFLYIFLRRNEEVTRLCSPFFRAIKARCDVSYEFSTFIPLSIKILALVI